jgi:hypothetical protein
VSVLPGISVSEIPSGIPDEGAFQGILEPACLFFPGNDASDDARQGKKDGQYFAKGAELGYKNILPEYFHVSGRGIKREPDLSADFFQGSVAIGIGIELSLCGHMVARGFLGECP